jgi:hypothetical protein
MMRRSSPTSERIMDPASQRPPDGRDSRPRSEHQNFVTQRLKSFRGNAFEWNHAAQTDRREADDRCRAPGAYRAARAAGVSMIRLLRPVDHRSRARRWRDTVAELTKYWLSTRHGWKRYRRACGTVPPPMHCRRSAILLSPTCKRSNCPAVSAETDDPFRTRETQIGG